jgi:hypothetical protein
MNHSPNYYQSPLAPFPGQSAPRLYGCTVAPLHTPPWRLFVAPTGKGFMSTSLSENYAFCKRRVEG